ncbi:group II intron reverse transcriptase/maturase [Bacillus cereus]|nr:group II intron reverse transcriptase/maturase [Bacillus cereus]
MRNPDDVLGSLVTKSNNKNYKYNRLYRNLYNPSFYLKAYTSISPNQGNMTKGTDGKNIDGFSLEKINILIESLKDESYQPYPSKRVFIPKKNDSKRPLGIPAFKDKLLQEVIRMILEAIYEKSFKESSHGFRPKRSCHTALYKVRKTFTGVKWFVEGDISGFFDNIDHHTLIALLRRRITDEKFIRLIWKFLRAGYLEEWQFQSSYSGTPQGGVISPLLSNVYLTELDIFMEEYKKEFTKGDKRKTTKSYKRQEYLTYKHRKQLKENWEQLTEQEKKQGIIKYKSLKKELLKITCGDPMDESYKRIQYVRYADDFLVGIIGNKADAMKVKEDLTDFLRNKLKLELSQEKTLITHSSKKARFLGYDIMVSRKLDTKRDKNGFLMRHQIMRCKLYLPSEKWIEKLKHYGALRIMPNGKWRIQHRTYLLNNDELEILNTYNMEIRGLYNYYSLAENVCTLQSFYYFMKYSFAKTLAAKHKMSVAKVMAKYKVKGHLAIQYQAKSEKRISYFYNDGFRRKDKVMYIVQDTLPNSQLWWRNSLIKRLSANRCEWCGKNDVPLEMHHVKKLKDLEGKKLWEKKMIARKRKTLALCARCHQDLHSGKLDG